MDLFACNISEVTDVDHNMCDKLNMSKLQLVCMSDSVFNDMTHEHHYLPICFCEQVQNEQTKFWFLVPSPDLEGKNRALYPQTSFDDMNILIDIIHLYNHQLISTYLVKMQITEDRRSPSTYREKVYHFF